MIIQHMSDSTVPAAVLETLERLSSKSGVIAAYAMEATSSTILATTGSLNFGTAHTASTTTTASPDALNSAGSYDTPLHASSTSTGANGPSEQPFDFATRIWQFVKFSRGLVQDLDGEVRSMLV